jgi:uncharacterized membrane protein YeaQ/YmgE (transglycosylase-associated protein family)
MVARFEGVAVGTEPATTATTPAAWIQWPVYWSAVWVGTLTALALALIIGLIGIAVGAHELVPAQRIVDWHKFGLSALIFSVVGAFLAFAAGGWVAGKIGGILRAEPAMLHGAIVWLVTVPFLLYFTSAGTGSYFGGWYGGLAGTPTWAVAAQTPPSLASDGAQPDAREREAARVARNSALGAVTALLLGLVGSVIGGWMASGEPMTFTHYRTRTIPVTR